MQKYCLVLFCILKTDRLIKILFLFPGESSGEWPIHNAGMVTLFSLSLAWLKHIADGDDDDDIGHSIIM